jgi:hypothetical protein
MMNRAVTVLYIVLCFEMGIILFVFPWLSLWTKNYFVDHYPLVSALARNYFFRGAISGIGLADIWLAIYELWHFRRQRQIIHSESQRKGAAARIY